MMSRLFLDMFCYAAQARCYATTVVDGYRFHGYEIERLIKPDGYPSTNGTGRSRVSRLERRGGLWREVDCLQQI